VDGVADQGLSEGAKAKRWFHERIEELSDRHIDEVWEVWGAPRDSELPSHYADGEPIPEWVFALREAFLRQDEES